MSKKNVLSQNIKQQTLENIGQSFLHLKKELFNLRFQKTLGELKNTSRFSVAKKEIARLKTELSVRKIREL